VLVYGGSRQGGLAAAVATTAVTTERIKAGGVVSPSIQSDLI
jgi:hypothetical protein